MEKGPEIKKTKKVPKSPNFSTRHRVVEQCMVPGLNSLNFGDAGFPMFVSAFPVFVSMQQNSGKMPRGATNRYTMKKNGQANYTTCWPVCPEVVEIEPLVEFAPIWPITVQTQRCSHNARQTRSNVCRRQPGVGGLCP